MTKFLLDCGADLFARNKKGNTIAHEICLWKDVTCQDFKIWVGAMIEIGHFGLFAIRGELGRTCLDNSMQRLDVDVETMKMIIDAGKLDINKRNEEGDTTLHLALNFGRSVETLKGLVELGADWKMRRNANRCSVMHSVVQEGNKQAFLLFKSLGADVNVEDEMGQTPLHYVRWTEGGDDVAMTKFLLENGADVNSRDKLGRSMEQLMSDWLSYESYCTWKQGMVELGYSNLFEH